MTAPLPSRIDWFAPWTWKPGHWLAAFIIVPPLYLVLVIVAEQSTINEPKNSWVRSVVSVIRAPLEPLRRPFRRTATRKIAELVPNCEVCGKVADVRFCEFVIVSGNRHFRVRGFCEHHHREYLDGPADALMPIAPLSPDLD